jgi:hypothetical protein
MDDLVNDANKSEQLGELGKHIDKTIEQIAGKPMLYVMMVLDTERHGANMMTNMCCLHHAEGEILRAAQEIAMQRLAQDLDDSAVTRH